MCSRLPARAPTQNACFDARCSHGRRYALQTLPRKLALSRYQLKRSLADLQDDGGHTQGDTATNDDEDPSRGDHEVATTTKEKSDSETNVATAAGGAVVAAIISFFFAATACLLGRRRATDADEPVVGSPLARAVKGVLERLDALAAEHQRVMRASLSSLSGDVAGVLPHKNTPAGPYFDEECKEAPA